VGRKKERKNERKKKKKEKRKKKKGTVPKRKAWFRHNGSKFGFWNYNFRVK
jgi:hypothetical protein